MLESNMKPSRLFLIISLLFAASSFYAIKNYQVLTENPFNDNLEISYPSQAIRGNSGYTYIIDNSKRRITKISENAKIDFIIDGGKKEDGTFFYANDLAVDENGNLYVLNLVLDEYGFFTTREEILKFSSNGKFVKKLYSQEYDHSEKPEPTHVQRGQIVGLSYERNRLFFYDITKSKILLKSCGTDSENLKERTFLDLENANLLIADITRINAIEAVIATKSGNIFRYNETFKRTNIYSGDEVSSTNNLSIPWAVTENDSEIYFVDLGDRSIKSIQNGNARNILSQRILKDAGYELENYLYNNISYNKSENILTASNEGFIISINSTGEIVNVITGGEYPVAERVYKFSVWISIILILIFAYTGFRIIYVHYMKRKFSPLLLKILVIIFIIIIAAVMVSNIIIKNFSTRYQSEVISKMSQLTQILPDAVETDRILKINKQNDFMNEDYQIVRNQFLKALNYNKDPWNNSIYFAIYRVINNELYGFMYLNGYINAYHPFDYGYESEDSMYRLAKQGEINAEIDSDSMGTWLYSLGPIKDSQGNVIAILEIGTDLYAFRQANLKLVKNILLDVITMLAVFILLIVEFSFLGNIISFELNNDVSIGSSDERRKTKFFDVNMARPLAFMYFTPVSMSLVFIPLMMKRFYQPVFGISEKFAIALPISAEMFFFGIATIISGGLINKYGWRKIFNLGMVLTGIGLLASGFAFEMWSFIAARSVFGLASGITLLSIRGFINIERREKDRNVAFSNYYSGLIVGANVGAILGAILSDHIGYSNVFFFAFGILTIPLFFAWRYLTDHAVVDRRSRITGLKLSASLKKFFMNKNVFLYTLLLIIPTYIAGTFIQYYFPLFAEEQGMSVANIGRVFLLNGFFIIYLGPTLTKFMEKHFGSLFSAALSSILWGISLFIAAYFFSITGAIIAIILMGITEGFGVASQNSIFYKFKVVNEIGVDTSVGYFELVAKLAETIAPLIFAAALLLGPKLGLTVIGAAVVICYIIFRITAGTSIGDEIKDNEEEI